MTYYIFFPLVPTQDNKTIQRTKKEKKKKNLINMKKDATEKYKETDQQS